MLWFSSTFSSFLSLPILLFVLIVRVADEAKEEIRSEAEDEIGDATYTIHLIFLGIFGWTFILWFDFLLKILRKVFDYLTNSINLCASSIPLCLLYLEKLYFLEIYTVHSFIVLFGWYLLCTQIRGYDMQYSTSLCIVDVLTHSFYYIKFN